MEEEKKEFIKEKIVKKTGAVIICRIWDDKVEIYEDRRQKEVMV